MTELTTVGQRRWSFARIAVITVPLVLLLGQVSGRVAGAGERDPWFAALAKPELYPPGALFGIVWTVLYAMMAVALAIVIDARGARARGVAVALFGTQLILNLAWAPLFFRYHQIAPAFWLIVAIFVASLATTLAFGSVRRVAGWLLVPYLIWLSFAGVLAWRVWQLNPNA